MQLYYSYSTIFDKSWPSVSDAGLFWGISVLAEIVSFFSTRLFKNWSITALSISPVLRLSCVGFAFGYADTFVEIVLTTNVFTVHLCRLAITRPCVYITTQPQNPYFQKFKDLYNVLAGCSHCGISLRFLAYFIRFRRFMPLA